MNQEERVEAQRLVLAKIEFAAEVRRRFEPSPYPAISRIAVSRPEPSLEEEIAAGVFDALAGGRRVWLEHWCHPLLDGDIVLWAAEVVVFEDSDRAIKSTHILPKQGTFFPSETQARVRDVELARDHIARGSALAPGETAR